MPSRRSRRSLTACHPHESVRCPNYSLASSCRGGDRRQSRGGAAGFHTGQRSFWRALTGRRWLAPFFTTARPGIDDLRWLFLHDHQVAACEYHSRSPATNVPSQLANMVRRPRVRLDGGLLGPRILIWATKSSVLILGHATRRPATSRPTHDAICYHHPLPAAAAETDRHRQLLPDLPWQSVPPFSPIGCVSSPAPCW
jgi:hypothetical protein